jgi:hypothetical protein
MWQVRMAVHTFWFAHIVIFRPAQILGQVHEMTVTAQIPEVTDYEKLRKPIQDIINFTDTIDGQYREKCFEILLGCYIAGGGALPKGGFTVESARKEGFVIEDMSSEMKTFLGEHNITEEMLNKLFVREKGEIHPLYKITETKRAKAQIQIALLAAIENALRSPSEAFEFHVNVVRQRCMDIKMYDGRDFFINFMDHAGLFGSLSNYEVIKVSPIGKMELANIILALFKQ